MEMNYLMGLDIGTSSVKGVLVTTGGQIVRRVREPFHYRKTGTDRVELLPDEYLETCCRVIRSLASGAEGGQILALTASSASGNLILLDEKDCPLTNIISWEDKRVTGEAEELLQDLDKNAFYRRIGWPYGFRVMPLSQLCYLKMHDPSLLAGTGTVAMSTEYLCFRLTGKWGISPSAGTTYYLIDRESKAYIPGLLDRLGLAEDQFPPVLPCGSLLGTVLDPMAAKCGLTGQVPVVLGCFDHPSAARGVGVLREGDMLLSCGTSWVVFCPVRDVERAFSSGGLVDPFLSPDGCYGVMSSISSLSSKLMRYAGRYLDHSDQVFQKMSSLAKRSIPGANGLTVDLLSEPDDLVIRSHRKADIARAIMESAVRLVKERVDRLARAGIRAERAVMAGGPSEEPYWRELLEEALGIPVRVHNGAYAGAVGAAIIGGIGAGVYRDEYEAEERFLRRNNG